MDNLVLNQHAVPYIHVPRTVPIFMTFIYMAFCIKMVYFIPLIPMSYLLKCRPYDGGVTLLNLF